jgi:hypothetical protein
MVWREAPKKAVTRVTPGTVPALNFTRAIPPLNDHPFKGTGEVNDSAVGNRWVINADSDLAGAFAVSGNLGRRCEEQESMALGWQRLCPPKQIQPQKSDSQNRSSQGSLAHKFAPHSCLSFDL